MQRNKGVNKVVFITFILFFGILFLFSQTALANQGLNGIGVPQESSPQVVNESIPVTESVGNVVDPTIPNVTESGSSAEAVGQIMDGIGVDGEAVEKANKYLEPVAKIVNVIFAFLLGAIFLGTFVITGADLLYISVPPVRSLLSPSANQQSSGGMMGGYGAQQQQSSSGFRIISDEAVAAAQALQGGSTGAMSGGYSGLGVGGLGGGYSGGGFGGGYSGGTQEPPKMKSVLLDYMKKRIFFLVLLGVAGILFSTTIFTDLGMKLGVWVMELLLKLL